jgi:hypothetical protein
MLPVVYMSPGQQALPWEDGQQTHGDY